MKVPTKTHYALKILTDLAMFGLEEPCAVSKIAARQDIPRQFLQQILLALKGAGMVKSSRGLKGGYMLSQKPGSISVRSVVDATQGDLLSPPYFEAGHGNGVEKAVNGVWTEARSSLESMLQSVTIKDLIRKASDEEGTSDYSI